MVQGCEQSSFPHSPPLWGAEHLSPSSHCCDGSYAASPHPPSFAFLYRGLWICRALYLILPRLWNPPAYQRNGLENKTSLISCWMTKECRKRICVLWECWEFQKLWEEPVWIWIRGSQVGSSQGLTGASWWVGVSVQWSGWSFHTPTGISASPWASFCRGKAQAWRGWIFLMKELPCGCMFTLQDVTTMQLSTDIDKVKCHLEALCNVKIGCGSNHLSYCSKTAYSIWKEKNRNY